MIAACGRASSTRSSDMATTSDAAVFERARRLGFAGVEVVLQRGDLRSRRLESLRRAMETTGLEIPSLVLGVHNEDGGIADADPAVAARAADQTCTAIAWAAELGADVVLVPFFLRGELVGQADVRRCADGFTALCPPAAAVGRGALLRGDAAGRSRPRARGSRRLAGVRVLFRPREPGRQRPRLRDGGEAARRARQAGALQGRARTARRLPARSRPCRLRRVCARADADRATKAGSFSRRRGAAGGRGAGPELCAPLLPRSSPGLEWPRFGVFTHELGVSRSELDVGLSRPRRRVGPALARPPRRVAGGAGAARRRGRRDRRLQEPDRAGRRGAAARTSRTSSGASSSAPLAGTSVVSTHAGTRHPTEEWSDSPENLSPEAWSLLLDAVERLLAVAERCGHDPGARRIGEERAEDGRAGDRAPRSLPFAAPRARLRSVQLRIAAPPARPRARRRRSSSTGSSTASSSRMSRTSARTARKCPRPQSAPASSRRSPTSRSCGSTVPTCG